MADYSDYLDTLGLRQTPDGPDPVQLYLQRYARPQPSGLAPGLGQPPTPDDAAPAAMPAQAPPPPAMAQPPPPAPMAGGKRGKQPAAPDEFTRSTRDTAQMQIDAVQRRAAAETAQQAEIAEKSALAETASANRQREIEDQRASIYSTADRRTQEIVNEQKALGNQKVDPGKEFRGAAGTIAVAAMGFLSGALAPKGGSGVILGTIDKIVQRSVDAQLADITNKRQSLSEQQKGVDTQLARGDNLADARLRAELRGYDSAVKIIQSEATKKWGGELGAAKAQELTAGILQQKQDKIQQHNDTLVQQGLQKSQVGQGWARLKQDKEQFKEDTRRFELGRQDKLSAQADENAFKERALDMKDKAKLPDGLTPKEARELVVHGPDGRLLGYARNPAAAEKVSDRVEQYEDFRKDLVDYAQMVKSNGRQFSGVAGYGQSKEFAEMESLHTRLLLVAKEKAKLGVLSGSDLEMITKQLPAPRSLVGGADPLPGVRNTLEQLDTSMDRFMKVNVPGAERYSPPSFDDFGGSNVAGLEAGPGRTPNSVPRSLRPQTMVGADPEPDPATPSGRGLAYDYAWGRDR